MGEKQVLSRDVDIATSTAVSVATDGVTLSAVTGPVTVPVVIGSTARSSNLLTGLPEEAALPAPKGLFSCTASWDQVGKYEGKRG